MTNIDISPLFDPNLPFSSSKIPSQNQFALLVRLHDFLTSPEQEDLSKYSDQQILSAQMKAEWCLWEGYSKWDIALNPFLGHFVEKWEARQQTGDTLIVGIILSGRASELNDMTTADVLNRPPSTEVLDQNIPMRNLQIALLNQQYAPTDPLFAKNPILAIGEQTVESDFGSDKVTIGDATSIQGGAGILSVPPSPAPMGRGGSMNLSMRERERQMREMLSKGLEKAYTTNLSEDEVITLTDLVQKVPEMTIEIIEPTIQFFLGTIENNAQLFRESILPLLINSPLREETFSTLTFLPPSLPVLETLSLLISANPEILRDQDSQGSRIVHEFIAHAGRQLEALATESGGRDKASRQVVMTCLFLTALLRDGRINVEEYAIEIRGFCVNFLWVVEAAELFQNLSDM